MKRRILVCAVAVLGLSAAAYAEIKVTVGYNNNATTTREFMFKNVPSPVKDDAAASAKLAIVSGEADSNGADLSAITDGILPSDEDQPAANFFFNAGTAGGRFSLDLGSAVEIMQVNSYSWHPNTRGPQVYKLFGADGTAPGFKAAPGDDADPAACGWKLVATVDTRPQQGDGGGQYGVSISDSGGVIGKYRYLLFRCVATEIDDDYGNTFYSEIDVITKK